MKTVIVVYKSGKIIFRGRVLNDVTDYWNNKTITCEGELGFLQDSFIRPFNFAGTAEALFEKLINEHNSQVDSFKRFKIGKVSVNNSIILFNNEYETCFDNVNNRLIEESLGGYLYITHENGDEIPTIHYLADFENVASQVIEFGSNLKNYTKTVNAGDIGTAVIPLGAQIDDGNSNTEDKRLTIASVNGNVDYLYNAEAVASYGWIFKTVVFDDVTSASVLKDKGTEYLDTLVNQVITIELNAIDLHLLDRDIESFKVGDYIQVNSEPHNFNGLLLCNKQTINLLKPENDTVTLGHNYTSFTEKTANISQIPIIKTVANKASSKAEALNQEIININNTLAISTPIRSISDSLTVTANSISEFDIAFSSVFTVTPAIVIVTPNINKQGLTVNIAVSNITTTGFHVCIKNDNSSDITLTLMYVVYPTIEEGE